MGLFQEFKEFAVKGNVIDLAVGIIIGAAFNGIVKALEMKDEKEAIDQFGSSDSGASLGDILGAALREKAGSKE